MLLKKIEKKTAEILEMPKDTALDLPKIILTGNEELYCGGYKGIRLFSENEIRFSVAHAVVTVIGEKLSIKSIEAEEITVIGKIKSVEFI